MRQKCIIVLSEKSCGSTIVQELIASFADIKYVEHTRHRENETLYWTKAASVLGCPQRKMVASEVPIPAHRARQELIEFISQNLNDPDVEIADKQSIFKYWEALNYHYGPVFVEKSPHHLLQQSVIQLIFECSQYLPDIDFYIVGLIRNPMDVIYSQFKRWGSSPQKIEAQWLAAYKNFELCEALFGERFTAFRYEDLCTDSKSVDELVRFLGLDVAEHASGNNVLDKPSIAKWKADINYGFNLTSQTLSYCTSAGYQAADLSNRNKIRWPLYRMLYGSYMSTRICLRDLLVKAGLKSI